MVVTWGTLATLANMASTRVRTPASATVAPWVVPKTICSVSPDTFGDTASRSWMASVDWVFGREKLLEKSLPTWRESAVTATRATTQNNTTRRRWRTHQLARTRIGERLLDGHRTRRVETLASQFKKGLSSVDTVVFDGGHGTRCGGAGPHIGRDPRRRRRRHLGAGRVGQHGRRGRLRRRG